MLDDRARDGINGYGHLQHPVAWDQ